MCCSEAKKINEYLCYVQLLSHVWLCSPMNCSTPGFPVFHHLLEFVQTHLSWWFHSTISSSVTCFSCPQSFPVSGSFPMSRLFTSGGQSTAEIYLPLNLAKYVFSQHTRLFLCCLLRRKNICWKHPWWRLSAWKGFQLMLWRETREIEL